MGALRKLQRQQRRREIKPALRVSRELGPISGALLDLVSHAVDPAVLDEEQLRLVLAVATAAWNEAFSTEHVEDLRRLFREELGERADETQALFDHFVEVRREHFAHDRRVVLSTGIDYPNGQRRVLAASALMTPRAASEQVP
jgi:hypothetical protein